MNTITLTQITIEELEEIITKAINSAFKKVGGISQVIEQDRILTIDEAAEFLSLSRATIYDLTSRSAIPFLKKRRRLYFSKEDLITWLKDSRRGTKAEADQEADSYLAGIKKKKQGN